MPGRPLGSRTAFTQGFLKDLAEVWSEEGRETMIKPAKDQPTTFFAVCARLIPSDVKLTVEQTDGGLAAEDYAVLPAIECRRLDPEHLQRSPSRQMRLLDEADDLKLLRCGEPHV
jgi:hypothetical protein